MRHWSARYIGLPWRDHGRGWDGIDCYGLCKLVLQGEWGIALPSYTEAYSSAHEIREVAEAIKMLDARPWAPVGVPEPFDVLVFRRGAWATHVGIAVDGQRMLHVEKATSSCIVPFTDGRWLHKRVACYRHAGLMADA
jgi:cell wall-associated NlpC family hydrolase